MALWQQEFKDYHLAKGLDIESEVDEVNRGISRTPLELRGLDVAQREDAVEKREYAAEDREFDLNIEDMALDQRAARQEAFQAAVEEDLAARVASWVEHMEQVEVETAENLDAAVDAWLEEQEPKWRGEVVRQAEQEAGVIVEGAKTRAGAVITGASAQAARLLLLVLEKVKRDQEEMDEKVQAAVQRGYEAGHDEGRETAQAVAEKIWQYEKQDRLVELDAAFEAVCRENGLTPQRAKQMQQRMRQILEAQQRPENGGDTPSFGR